MGSPSATPFIHRPAYRLALSRLRRHRTFTDQRVAWHCLAFGDTVHSPTSVSPGTVSPSATPYIHRPACRLAPSRLRRHRTFTDQRVAWHRLAFGDTVHSPTSVSSTESRTLSPTASTTAVPPITSP